MNIFNVLNHAVMEGESPDYLAATLEELINCTVWHFSHEERLMLKYRYAETEEHKAEHRELITSAKELQKKILQADEPVANEHIEFLERWLTDLHRRFATGFLSFSSNVGIAAERLKGSLRTKPRTLPAH